MNIVDHNRKIVLVEDVDSISSLSTFVFQSALVHCAGFASQNMQNITVPINTIADVNRNRIVHSECR